MRPEAGPAGVTGEVAAWRAIDGYLRGPAAFPITRVGDTAVVRTLEELLVLGLRSASEEEARRYGTGALAAFQVRSGRRGSGIEYDTFKRAWDHWLAMTGDNEPLQRCATGRRDWDFNLDGLAHYGLMPDFLQDLRNVGLPTEGLVTLFRSAEDYIRVWDRCWAVRQVHHPDPPQALVPDGVSIVSELVEEA